MISYSDRLEQFMMPTTPHPDRVIGPELVSLEPVTLGRACITLDSDFVPPQGWSLVPLENGAVMYHEKTITNEDFIENVREYVNKLRSGNAYERRYAMLYLARIVSPTAALFNRYVFDWINATHTESIDAPHAFYVDMTMKSATDIITTHLSTLYEYYNAIDIDTEILPLETLLHRLFGVNFTVHEVIDLLYDLACMQIIKNMSDIPEYNEQGHCQVIHKSAYMRMTTQIHDVAIILREGFRSKHHFFRESIANETYTGVEFQRIVRSILSVLFVFPPSWLSTNEVVFVENASSALPAKLTQTYSNSLNNKFVDQLVVNGINSQFTIPRTNVIHFKRKRTRLCKVEDHAYKRVKLGPEIENTLNMWRKVSLFDTTHGRTGANEQAVKSRDVYGHIPVHFVSSFQHTGPHAHMNIDNKVSFAVTLFHVDPSEFTIPHPQSLFMWDVFAGNCTGIELALFDKQRFTFHWEDDKQSYSGHICHTPRLILGRPDLKAYHAEFTNIVNPNQTSQRITHKQTRQYVTLIAREGKLVQVQFVMCLGSNLL